MLTWLVKRAIFHHIVPAKLASILALLLCNGNLSLFKLSAFILRFHYFGRCTHTHTSTRPTKLHRTILVPCFSVIKSSLMIESTGQVLYCLPVADKAFFSVPQWRCLVLPIQLFSRSNAGTNLHLLRLSFGLQSKWREKPSHF